MKISKLFDIFRHHISESIFDELDNQSLINCKEASRDWSELDCNKCRAAFICGMITRRYHCRACGQVFCGKCSSKSCHLPKFGIKRQVRVCDTCFKLYGPKKEVGARPAAL